MLVTPGFHRLASFGTLHLYLNEGCVSSRVLPRIPASLQSGEERRAPTPQLRPPYQTSTRRPSTENSTSIFSSVLSLLRGLNEHVPVRRNMTRETVIKLCAV